MEKAFTMSEKVKVLCDKFTKVIEEQNLKKTSLGYLSEEQITENGMIFSDYTNQYEIGYTYQIDKKGFKRVKLLDKFIRWYEKHTHDDFLEQTKENEMDSLVDFVDNELNLETIPF